ncbi:hypothetical protein L204_101654 [Cryptococcus depauperatus]|nr:hypothetical protein L204_04382 [Cryptococcus depauperatus CBS 7855]
MASLNAPANQVPSGEALALSASIFTSSIANWIPANFGVTKSELEKVGDFESVLREERGGRLGLGHPLLDDSKRASGSRTNGLVGLNKKLVNERKGKEREEPPRCIIPTMELDEEESRANSVGRQKKKETAFDLFEGKKKRKAPDDLKVHPLAQQDESKSPSSSQPTIPKVVASLSKSDGEDEDSEIQSPLFPTSRSPLSVPSTPPLLSSPGGSGVFPFSGPLVLESPVARKLIEERKARKRKIPEDKEREREKMIEGKGKEESAESVGTPTKGEKKSKTQLRREARKRMKLAQSQQNGN